MGIELAPRRQAGGERDGGEDRDDCAALLRAGTLRALVVLALVAAGLCAVLVAAVATVLDVPGQGGGLVLAVALVALAAAPAACWALEQGRWSGIAAVAAFQAGCAAVLVAAYLTGCLFCALRAADAISARGPYGATVLEVVGWLAVTAGGLLLLALLVASIPLPPGVRRNVRWLPAAIATVAAAVAFMAGGTQVLASDCDRFAFDHDRWRGALAGDVSERDTTRLFAAVVRCGTVAGMDPDELLATLGRPSSRSEGEWRWVGPGARTVFATAPALNVVIYDGHVTTVATDEGLGGD
jgi:hypothetical protein